MKRAALTHPKMLDLASKLGIFRFHAIGIITLFLDWTADDAVAGDIGKWPDGAIARACEWHSDATEFVAALVAAGWLDINDCQVAKLYADEEMLTKQIRKTRRARG
ncbi:MAG: hypothetical protein JXM70_28475 [Pirellulales bacterium]|nr:hypothetical protein [Pirellulales bacterium]